jgi:hypothetical protein
MTALKRAQQPSQGATLAAASRTCQSESDRALIGIKKGALPHFWCGRCDKLVILHRSIWVATDHSCRLPRLATSLDICLNCKYERHRDSDAKTPTRWIAQRKLDRIVVENRAMAKQPNSHDP